MLEIRRLITVGLLPLVAAALVLAADPKDAKPPTTAPAVSAPPTDQEPVISRTRLQEIKGCNYIYATAETTLSGLSACIQQLMEPMTAAIEEGKLRPVGPPVFVYKGVTHDRDKPFMLEVGFPVKEDAKAVDELKLRPLDNFRCCGALYSGPIQQISQAYQQIFSDLFTLGVEPSGEVREMYLYWDAPESPNNVVMVMAGLK